MKWDTPGGSVRAESCRHPSKSSSLCSRAKNVVAPPRPPVRFFAPDAPVVDLYLGQIDQVERLRSVAEISLVFFYAPWCAHSIAARQELQQVAKKLARQVRRSWRQNRQRGPPDHLWQPGLLSYRSSLWLWTAGGVRANAGGSITSFSFQPSICFTGGETGSAALADLFTGTLGAPSHSISWEPVWELF